MSIQLPNTTLVDGQVDLTKLSEEQIAQMEADLLLRRNTAKQNQSPTNQS